MTRTTLILASLLALWAAPAFAQVIVSPPVVTYYSPSAPVVTSYSPSVYSSTVVRSPVTTYYSPAVAAPLTTYYSPAQSYVAPTTSYYAPVSTYYGGSVVTPAVGQPVTVGRSVYGTLTPYVPGQPVRNTVRFAVP
jgi:hypothetical protein